MSDRTTYENPLASRYASPEMSRIWSPQFKFSTWRRWWHALATAEMQLGISRITQPLLDEMAAHLDDINFEAAEEEEKKTRHDVMSHVHAFGLQCPAAKPIIHLGATSCFVTDNTELVQMRESLRLIRARLLQLMTVLRDQAEQYAALPVLGFTHYQPAQLTTFGKRLCLYLQDFLLDYQALDRFLDELPCRGVKGTTGTQATFLELFEGDHAKVRELDQKVAELMGFSRSIAVSGQTYTRKLDFQCLSILSGIAQSAYKMAGDFRLLMNLKEMEEPFGKNQIGSSAMAYKRNPMRSERICAISRFVMSLTENAAHTHANQWFERTLDDSANRRLSLPEAFLGIDIVLSIASNIVDGMVVYPKVIRRRIDGELPFMATEAILMAAVKLGGDRQALHEAIRVHAFQSAERSKTEGVDNDLFERLAGDPLFAAVKDQFSSFVDPDRFVGRAPQQVKEFLFYEIEPVLKNADSALSTTMGELNV